MADKTNTTYYAGDVRCINCFRKVDYAEVDGFIAVTKCKACAGRKVVMSLIGFVIGVALSYGILFLLNLWI